MHNNNGINGNGTWFSGHADVWNSINGRFIIQGIKDDTVELQIQSYSSHPVTKTKQAILLLNKI